MLIDVVRREEHGTVATEGEQALGRHFARVVKPDFEGSFVAWAAGGVHRCAHLHFDFATCRSELAGELVALFLLASRQLHYGSLHRLRHGVAVDSRRDSGFRQRGLLGSFGLFSFDDADRFVVHFLAFRLAAWCGWVMLCGLSKWC